MNKNIVFFDLETTGTSVTKDRAVQISAIKTNSNLQVIEPPKKILINPEMTIPEEASKVHGITDEMVKDKPTFSKYAKNMFTFFDGCALGGYNIKRFDVPLLAEEFGRCGYNFPDTNVEIYDIMKVFMEFEKRDLTAAYKFYTGKILENAHDAEVDNLATIEIAENQLFMHDISIVKAIEMCKDETNNVDFSGKIILINGVACYSFGKHKNEPVTKYPDFGDWMLKPSSDFTTNTKNVVRAILGYKNTNL